MEVKLCRSGEFETLLMKKFCSIEECVSRYMEFNLVFKRGHGSSCNYLKKMCQNWNCRLVLRIRLVLLHVIPDWYFLQYEFSYKYHIPRLHPCLQLYKTLVFGRIFLAHWQIVFSTWWQISAFLGFRLSNLDLFFGFFLTRLCA